MRVKMTLSYDGSKFYGFQIQNSGVATVANRLCEIFDSLGIKSDFAASGRTDRGVHALSQVISLDLPSYWRDLRHLKRCINEKALPSIYIDKIEVVDKDFHARFSAKKRAYRYVISDKKPNVFLSDYVLFVEPFDCLKIKESVDIFKGTHDFSYFAKEGSGVSHYKREIYKTRFYRFGDFYIFGFEADGFVRSQIRLMVSALLKVGFGKLDIDDLKDQLSLKKSIVRDPVEPNGLYLSRIWY